MLEERKGADLVGWHYRGPFDDLGVVARTFEAAVDERGASPYVHRVIAWDEVGEEEGTSIVHIAPGGGAEDFRLGKQLGLPVIAPLDEAGHYLEGFGPFTGMDAAAVTAEIIEELEARGFFYHLEPYTHRYPHCWRCGTALLFRVVDEWYISMGPSTTCPASSSRPSRRRPACATRSWTSWTRSAGSPRSATSGSWTGSARCPTG